MTPQLQQAIQLLQMSNFELASVIDKEVAENPFLQRSDREAAPPAGPPPVNGANGSGEALRDRAAAGIDGGGPGQPSFRAADCSLALKRPAGNAFDDDRWSLEARLTRPKGLREHLTEQIQAILRDEAARLIAPQIVESVDDDGYLREPDEVLAARLRVEPTLVQVVRAALQRCEPTGVGACDLAECLSLQLAEQRPARPGDGRPAAQPAAAGAGRFRRADAPLRHRRRGPAGDDRRDQAARPEAGLSFGAEEPPTLVPDLFVTLLAPARWRVELNGGTLPKVLVDTAYHSELGRHAMERPDKEYLAERFQSANWLAKALDQRARTVLRVTKAIFARQIPFLDGGVAFLRPLVLRDIAEVTGLHESTVSRATSDKYVATPHGTFSLKYFFTTAIAATSGEASHSAEAIRQLIKRMIEREPAGDVLSDDQIVTELKLKGVVLARRTVAKYRESLGIASSVDRRRAKALGR